MSASAQNPSPDSDGSRKGGIWFALSLLAHGAILAWLIFLIPVAEIAVRDETGVAPVEPAVSASAERIQEVAEQIQATQAEEVRAKVDELLSTEESLAGLEAQTQAEFSALARELAADAPQKSRDALSAALEAQIQAGQAQAEALQAIQAMKEAAGAAANAPTPGEKSALGIQASAAAAQAATAQLRARDAQAAATAAQETASQQMGFEEGNQQAKTAQSQAAAAQAEANTKHDEAMEIRTALDALKRQAGRLAETAAAAERTRNRLQGRIAEKEKAESALQESLREQQERIEQLKQTAGEPNAPKEIAALSKSIEPVRKRLAAAKTDLENMHRQLAEEARKIAPATAAAAKAAEDLQKAPDELQAAQAAALQAQQNARVLQSEALTVAASASSPASPPPDAEAMPVAEMNSAPSLDGKSFSELYSVAVETEKSIAERYQAIRAAQVAVHKQIPLAEAQKYVQVALPIRSELPPEASATEVKDAAALAAQNAAMEKALKELESMLALTRGMAAQARSTSTGGEGVTISAEDMKAQAAQEQQLAAMAMEVEGQPAVDLTEMMKSIEAGSPGGANGRATAGQGEGGTGDGQGAGSGKPGGTGSGGRSGGSGSGVPGFPAAGAVLGSVPGRKVHGGDYEVGAKWMYIDTWWVIGPFPNPQRRNLETRFPPESVIDLDASYPVEGDVVSWQFVQNSSAMVRPPRDQSYAIFYAYTELWFDEARDLWIAMGSDDYSKIWLNNLPVWASGTQHKPWRANEGYRKVHFQKGLNRVLLRLENGQHSSAFSLMLCMQTNP